MRRRSSAGSWPLTSPIDRPVVDLDAALLSRWGVSAATLIADTPTSRVSRVSLTDGGTAVVKDLKPIGAEEELRGADCLAWRNGDGCVRLLERSGSTLLLEDAGDASLLGHLDRHGDHAATAIMAAAVAAIHRPVDAPVPSGLESLEERFASLLRIARQPGVDPLLVVGARVGGRCSTTSATCGRCTGTCITRTSSAPPVAG